MERKPAISVCLAAYNGESYIREAIDSVLTQSFSDFELIVSDDGSTDQTQAIGQEYAIRDARIKYIRHDINRGGFWNNNFLLNTAQGDYITFLSQDDSLKTDFLKKTCEYLTASPQRILIASDFEIMDEFGNITNIAELTKIRETIPWQTRCLEFFRDPRQNVHFCLYGVARKEILKKVYTAMPWPKKLIKASEVPLLCRLAAEGEVASIPLVLRRYRRHSQSAYAKEMARLRALPHLRRRLILLIHLYKLRFDQLKVLLSSSLPFGWKMRVIAYSYASYSRVFLGRLVGLPRKLLTGMLNKPSYSK